MRPIPPMLCAFALLVVASASANPVRLTLAVEPAQSLPGIPVTFRVTAINTSTSSVPVSLPSYVRLEMTSGAVTSIVYPGARGERDLVPFPLFGGAAVIELEPGEERSLDYFAAPGSPPWFCDERLQRPGTYRLRLRADRELSEGSWVPSLDPSISNEVLLTINAPSGTDAEVWTLIGGGNVCLGWDRHAATLWSQFPDSIYTSMTVRPSPRRDRAAELASLEATLAKNPPTGFADALKQSIAHRHISLMERAIINGDVHSAFEHSEMAREMFEDLASKDTEAEIKAAAQRSLRIDVMTLPELQDYEARVRLVAPPRPRCETAQISAVRAEVTQLAANPGTNAKARAKLEAVVKHLDAYAAEVAKTPPAMSRALHELRGAVTEIDNASRSLIGADEGRRWMSGIVNAAAMSAQKAVEVAAADFAARANMLTQAQQNLAEAQSAANQLDFRNAARLYKAALDKAEMATTMRGTFC